MHDDRILKLCSVFDSIRSMRRLVPHVECSLWLLARTTANHSVRTRYFLSISAVPHYAVALLLLLRKIIIIYCGRGKSRTSF